MNKEKMKKILKIVLIVVFIIFMLFMINTIRKLIIIKELQRNVSKYTSSTNYHIKSVGSGMSDGITTTINSYNKEGKRLVILERSKEGKVEDKISMYDNGERKSTFSETGDEKKADIDSDFNFSMVVYDYFGETSNNMQLLCMAIASKVENIEYNGKKCYRIALQETNTEISEVYIEKETGLVIRTHFGSAIAEREYEFDTVQDEIFVEPDISQYKLVEK
ncbi:MAG: hypothetical protein HFJ29_01120 [Clostridia bacterium]|nr:hypothetical protein [Clostridia bacterium]